MQLAIMYVWYSDVSAQKPASIHRLHESEFVLSTHVMATDGADVGACKPEGRWG
jgi:hypothetical protein